MEAGIMVEDDAQSIDYGLHARARARITQCLRVPPVLERHRRPHGLSRFRAHHEPPVRDPRPKPPPDKPPPGKKRPPRDDPDKDEQPIKQPPGTREPPVKEPPRNRARRRLLPLPVHGPRRVAGELQPPHMVAT